MDASRFRQSIRWEDADYYVVLSSHCQVWRPMSTGKKDHASRSVIIAACGGLWMNDPRSRAYGEESLRTFCGE
eukprot:471054-Amphidinium_carterae.2